MKGFSTPMMRVVLLDNENIIYSSTCINFTCSSCYSYQCSDCVECPDVYTCDIFDCHTKYS